MLPFNRVASTVPLALLHCFLSLNLVLCAHFTVHSCGETVANSGGKKRSDYVKYYIEASRMTTGCGLKRYLCLSIYSC